MNTSRSQREKKLIQLMLIPISFILGIIPLIVRMKEATPKENIQADVMHIYEYTDCFSQGKAQLLIIITVVAVILSFFLFDRCYIKKDRYTRVGLAGIGLFLIWTILSTAFAEYKDLAIWGTYDRAEGGVIIVCYILIMIYSIYAFNEYKDMRFIILPLSILIVCNAILGIFQYFGYDLFMTDFAKKIIIPDTMAEAREQMAISYVDKRMYGTMGHYNYMGSFVAMLVPFFIVLIFSVEGIVKKISLGMVTIAGLVLLFGSTSRAGLVGFCVTMLVLLIILGKQVVVRWKLGVGVIISLGILLVGLNFITEGSIFERIPTLIKDVKQVVGIDGEKIDYRDYIPIREFRNEVGEVVVVLQQGEIHFNVSHNEVVITNENGEQLVYGKVVQDEAGSYVPAADDGEIHGLYRTQEQDYNTIQYSLGTTYIRGESTEYIKIGTLNDDITFTCRIDYTKQELQLIDDWTGDDVTTEVSPSIGFKGSERLGSARGYIWSRTLPMLKDTILIGKGPDCFLAYFPRYDRLAKYWAYDGYSRVNIDKPHDLYLQIAINEGGIALIGFLILVGSYLVRSFQLYAFKSSYSKEQLMGIALMASIIGYLVAGIFNDSAISVAPIFWVLLGVGISFNEKQAKEQTVGK